MDYKQLKDLKPEATPYYQALIDNRDIPYVVRGLALDLVTACSDREVSRVFFFFFL